MSLGDFAGVVFHLFAWFGFGLAAVAEILIEHFQINSCIEPRFRLRLSDHWAEEIKHCFQGGSQTGKFFAQILLWTFWGRTGTFGRREHKDWRYEKNSVPGGSCKISESWISLAGACLREMEWRAAAIIIIVTVIITIIIIINVPLELNAIFS